MSDPASRPYELRLPRLSEPRVRDAVATVLDRWARAQPSRSQAVALGQSGAVMRLQLSDAQAATLLRELYATGLAPTGVVLRPLTLGVAYDRAQADPAFALFARRGGRFVPTWNWKAFVFGPFWYFRRGLYGKALVLLGLSVCPFFTLTFTLLLSCGILVYCGVVGNWDDYLWKIEGKQWW